MDLAQRERQAREEREAKARADVLRRLRWGLHDEPRIRADLGLQLPIGAVLRELVRRGEAVEVDGRYYLPNALPPPIPETPMPSQSDRILEFVRANPGCTRGQLPPHLRDTNTRTNLSNLERWKAIEERLDDDRAARYYPVDGYFGWHAPIQLGIDHGDVAGTEVVTAGGEYSRLVNLLDTVALEGDADPVVTLTRLIDERTLGQQAAAEAWDQLAAIDHALGLDGDGKTRTAGDRARAILALKDAMREVDTLPPLSLTPTLAQWRPPEPGPRSGAAENERLAARVQALEHELADSDDHLRAAVAAREQLEVQLAGCLTAAEGATNDPAIQGQYGWSVAYQRTLDLRNQFNKTSEALILSMTTPTEIELRAKIESLELECARLERYGTIPLRSAGGWREAGDLHGFPARPCWGGAAVWVDNQTDGNWTVCVAPPGPVTEDGIAAVTISMADLRKAQDIGDAAARLLGWELLDDGPRE